MANKTVLLTGASGKIGTVLCENLLKAGFRVVGISKRRESSEELLKKFPDGNLSVYQCDLMSEQERADLVKKLKKADLNIYGLINNARSLDTLKNDQNGKISQQNFIVEFELGVVAASDLTAQLTQDFPVKRIINISSIYGAVASNPHLYENPEHRVPVHYGVVKAALNHLTKELAVRLATKGVTVNAISYGGVEGRVSDEFKKRYAQLCPQEKMLSHKELPGIVQFLLSDESSAMTGQNLMVDGGWTLW